MRTCLVTLSISLVVLILTSCATEIRTPQAISPPQAPAGPVGEYLIQIGDTLDIKFFYHPELNESVVVRPDGRISLQLIHETQAMGLSPEGLRQSLLEKYAPQISKPEIAVIVRSFAAQKVYVDGEVVRPGLVQLAGPMTVLQAIASAGGMKDTARASDILIIRRNQDNQPEPLLVSLDKVIAGTDMTQDIALFPADIVYIPRAPIANLNLWIDKYIRLNIPFPFVYNIN